ncbi:MAG: Smr/MutS family protein, partial [Thermodesulfobacteriota bacterium]
ELKRDEAVQGIRVDRAKIIEKIRLKAKGVLKKGEAEIESALKEFNKKLEEAGGANKGSQKKAAIVKEAREALKGTMTSLYPEDREKEEVYLPEVEDRVEIKGTKTRGVVVRVDPQEREAELLVGKMKVKAPFEKLKLRGGELGGKAKKVFTKAGETAEIADLALSVNLLGMRVDEALSVVTAFLDNAHMNAQVSVQIIHGKGTGALKKAVREFLGESKIVKSFDDAPLMEGGSGVTVVTLR